MIDIHTHILPGIDDGAAYEEEAIAMLRMLGSELTAVIFTPHFIVNGFVNTKEILQDLFGRFVNLAKTEFPHMQFYLGAEAMLSPFLPEHLSCGELCTLHDTSYVLLELPFEVYPQWTDSVLDTILEMGFFPVIAHPERSAPLLRDASLVGFLQKKGVFFQVNAGSICGFYGKRVEEMANRLLREGFVSFVGSDAHSAEREGRNPLSLHEAYDRVAFWKGDRFAQKIFMDNPQRMLSNERI